MGRKQERAYTSYQYLEAGRDYRPFELAAELDRVPSTRVATTPEQEQRVQRLLAESLVISAHDHPSVRPADPAQAWHTAARAASSPVSAGWPPRASMWSSMA